MSRRVDYLNYIAFGKKDFRDLPEPITTEDKALYGMSVNGYGLPQRVNGFYRCLLNSQAGSQNFCSTILDLLEKRVDKVKVKFRFTLRRDTGTQLPTKIGLRLFANNSAGRDIVSGYNVFYDDMVTNAGNDIAENKEYVIENTFPPASQTGTPSTLVDCRYLKPFLVLSKGTVDDAYQIKHLIDVHEVSVEFEGKIIDITDTVSDFSPQIASNISYIENEISEQGLAIRKAPWFGKTVACMGDSITFGMQSGGNNTTKKEDDPWASQLKNYCGFTNVRNYGISGSTVSEVPNKSPMHGRINGMDANADIVIFMGGTNDLAGNVPLGEFKADDSQQLNTSTFYGALQTAIKALKTKYPNKPIVVMTPINGSNANIPNNTNPRTKLTMEDYRKAIREVTKFYGVYLFDLQNKVRFDALNDSDNVYFAETDKIHPNQAGHDEMARVISKFINEIA